MKNGVTQEQIEALKRTIANIKSCQTAISKAAEAARLDDEAANQAAAHLQEIQNGGNPRLNLELAKKHVETNTYLLLLNGWRNVEPARCEAIKRSLLSWLQTLAGQLFEIADSREIERSCPWLDFASGPGCENAAVQALAAAEAVLARIVPPPQPVVDYGGTWPHRA